MINQKIMPTKIKSQKKQRLQLAFQQQFHHRQK